MKDGEQLYASIFSGYFLRIPSAKRFAKPRSGVPVSHHTMSAYSAYASPRDRASGSAVTNGRTGRPVTARRASAVASARSSRREPTAAEWQGLRFAWRVAKHVKSNAIVLATADRVLGVGAGQMSRVDAARLAVMRAREHGHDPAGAVAASDAFFPFRDGLDVVAEAGATAVVHPGGSIRDDEVLAAADARGMAMVVTGLRHFKH